MAHLTEYSLIYSVAFLLAVAALCALRAYVGYKRIDGEALDDFTYKRSQNMIGKDVTAEAYVAAYRRINAPRASAYIAATMAIICLVTLPALGFINWLYVFIWESGVRDEAFTPGFLVHSLGIFFMTIIFWAGITYLAARRYHARARFNLDDEIAREMRG